MDALLDLDWAEDEGLAVTASGPGSQSGQFDDADEEGGRSQPGQFDDADEDDETKSSVCALSPSCSGHVISLKSDNARNAGVRPEYNIVMYGDP